MVAIPGKGLYIFIFRQNYLFIRLLQEDTSIG